MALLGSQCSASVPGGPKTVTCCPGYWRLREWPGSRSSCVWQAAAKHMVDSVALQQHAAPGGGASNITQSEGEPEGRTSRNAACPNRSCGVERVGRRQYRERAGLCVALRPLAGRLGHRAYKVRTQESYSTRRGAAPAKASSEEGDLHARQRPPASTGTPPNLDIYSLRSHPRKKKLHHSTATRQQAEAQLTWIRAA